MTTIHPTILNWSGGKDSAMAMYDLKQNPSVDLQGLVTTLNDRTRRVSMHGVREELLDRQAGYLGLPLEKVYYPESATMKQYESAMGSAFGKFGGQGITHSAFGDIFLEDLKEYRENQMQALGMKPFFPLWERDTRILLEEFLGLGFRAILVSVHGGLLGPGWAGREIDADFLRDLPVGVDPCGENGEFHTFVFDGPVFSRPVLFRIGETVIRSYPEPGEAGKEIDFFFTDLLPG